MDASREDLLQKLSGLVMSVIRHVRHPGPPGGPVLSPPQANLLFAIKHKNSGNGVSVKMLAEGTGVTLGAITQFVDALVEKGLVMREGDPSDRRIVKLKVTPLANQQFEKFRQEALASFSKVFEVLSDEEITQLIVLLSKIESSHNIKDRVNGEPSKTP